MATPVPAKKNIWEEFKEFLNKGDFLTIAVGLVIALYFQQIINALLVGVIYPIIAAIFGKRDFFVFAWTILAILDQLPIVLFYAFILAVAYGGAALGQLFVRAPRRPPATL